MSGPQRLLAGLEDQHRLAEHRQVGHVVGVPVRRADHFADGGLIVANTAWGMVTSTSRISPAEAREAERKDDISLTPLAMPLMSGPGSIGVVMALAAHVDSTASYIGMVIGIAGIAVSVLLFFWLGGPLVRRLGPSAVGAINKIFGFLILAIAVQLVWNGVADFRTN